VRDPLIYYHVNFGGTLSLCEVMLEFGVRRLLFSSSCFSRSIGCLLGSDGWGVFDYHRWGLLEYR